MLQHGKVLAVERDQARQFVLGGGCDDGVGQSGIVAPLVVAPDQTAPLGYLRAYGHDLEDSNEAVERSPLLALSDTGKKLGYGNRGYHQALRALFEIRCRLWLTAQVVDQYVRVEQQARLGHRLRALYGAVKLVS